ncbi:MAG: CDP-diacylglycerol--glycerol-3-phosphate 3-phosphatidyltransferase, partial [Clostridia bacterium]|nr:CDP-diacylglycerol--glycerol-3-phosphate 3-phosphatidyltransferase [Clostridia bacterium]
DVLGTISAGVGVSIIVAREMTVSVLRMIAATKNKVLAAEGVGKIKTFATDLAIIFLLVGVDFSAFFHVGFALYVLAVALTVYSGVFYLIKNKDVFN